jgi:hypothetical protein
MGILFVGRKERVEYCPTDLPDDRVGELMGK